MRLSKIAAAITAAVLLVASPMLGALTASAIPLGYVGTGANDSVFDNNLGDRVLDLMTVGEPYSDTLGGPQFGSGTTTWCWSVESGDLPDGITMTTPGNAAAPYATFSGTPQARPGTPPVLDFAFTIKVGDCVNETNYYLSFEGTLQSNKSPTITTLSAPVVASYGSIQLSASVAGNPVVNSTTPSGTVEFYAGSTLLGSGTLTPVGTTETSATLTLADIGTTASITAVYLGDDDYQTSTSSASDSLIYAPTVSGSVLWNGLPVEDAVLELFEAEDTERTFAIDTVMTLADGEFTLSPGSITTTGAATQEYFIQVTFPDGTVLYYESGAWNVTDLEDSTLVAPTTWDDELTLERRTPPYWDDQTLATPRVGAAYSDGVSATSPNPVSYSVDAGDLPSGLTLDPDTGEITGTPDACDDGGQTPFPFRGMSLPSCDYDFTIKADNGYGSVTKQFTGTLLPDGVPPTWEDDVLGSFQVGVAAADSVLAAGDPTIVYTVTGGTLPAGLVLSPSTGAITGIPTTAGPYEFTITAENDYGSITADFEGEVAASPDLDLHLDFAPGTSIEDAASTISAEGLLVGSTYTLTMFSTPRVLYTGTVDGTGGFTWVVSLPADTPAGAHKLVLTGTAADGTPMSATAWFTLGANGKILAISYTGPTGTLAATGIESGSALLLGGMLLLVGIGAVTIRRRRTA